MISSFGSSPIPMLHASTFLPVLVLHACERVCQASLSLDSDSKISAFLQPPSVFHLKGRDSNTAIQFLGAARVAKFSLQEQEVYCSKNLEILQSPHSVFRVLHTGLSAKRDSSPESSGSEAEGIRINKCFKAFASRREADRFIEDGRVCINGQLAGSGDRVWKGDKVTFDGDIVRWEQLNILQPQEKGGKGRRSKARVEPFVYVKYWKPRGVVCTTDQSIRGNIIDRISHPQRIFPVGRLDKDSTGLILLTSDGRVPNAVLRSGQRHNKRYIVRADRPVAARDVAELASGVEITTIAQRDRRSKTLTAPTLPCKVTKISRTELEITLQEGRNRQIRKMMEALGYEVVALHREEVMGIDLSGLRVGEWRDLSREEMSVIRRAIDAPPQPQRQFERDDSE